MSGFSVINNLNSMQASNYANWSINNVNSSLNKLSTGYRINQAADDAAGLAIANQLSADSAALNQGIINANNGMAYTQIADGALGQMNGMLNRAVELASQAANGTLSDSERKTLNTEYQEILKEIDRMSETTHFNGKTLLDGNGNAEIFVGDTHQPSTIDISISGSQGVNSNSMGLSNTSLLSAESARELLPQLNGAINQVSKWRGAVGAQQNGLQNSISIMMEQRNSLLGAESQIRDANMAEEVSKFMSAKILTQSSLSSMIQANNVHSSMVLSLLK